MKRSASPHESTLKLGNVAPVMTNSCSSFRPPYAHFAMIYLDRDGKLEIIESSSIREQNSTVFTPEVRQNFLEILGERIGYNAPVLQTTDTSPRQVKRRKGNPLAPSVDDRLTEQDTDSEDLPSGSTDMVPLRIGDTQNVMAYYERALQHFQQLNCRTVAKAFIKFIEPRKQVRHPYNGGKPPGSAPGTTGDPEKTKPEWWPLGVMHKEPDHLRKEYRIGLLLHIIRKLGPYGITADKLKDVAGDTKRSLKHPSNVEIIYEILRVRKMEERFERGEVDANMVVYITSRGPSPEGDKEDDSATSVATEEPEHINLGLMNPIPPFEQASTSLNTPNDSIPSACSLPGRLSKAEPLNFQNPAHDPPSYAKPQQYSDSSSESMLSTPMTAEMISPHNASALAFDYTAQTYPNSTPGVTGHYDNWTPSFPQNIFSPVHYATPVSSQGMPRLSMNDPVSHRHAHLPNMDTIHQRSLFLRTES
ncbi:Protein of unknown function DUF2841 [Penicillium canescens]|nr:Protein of unknown function DUF2841 [Penicillium canescens]KAJ6174622.1 Protein of unknown function DUF2841 [Penicillium canescens]